MKLQWSVRAVRDLARVELFIEPANSKAAHAVRLRLIQAAETVQTNPRLGTRVNPDVAIEIRRLIVGDYDIRYRVTADAITIARLWHSKQER